MNKLAIILLLILAIAAGFSTLLLYTNQGRLTAQIAGLKADLQKQTAENLQLRADLARISNQLTNPAPRSTEAPTAPDNEVLRLRGEVGKLRTTTQELAASKTNSPSTLSGLTANPEMFKIIRDQQKAGLGSIYRGLTNRVNLTQEQMGQLNELLANNVMENIDRITEVLRGGLGPTAMESVFANQEVALREKVRSLLGDEALTQYDEYTRNLASQITAEQFKAKLTGEAEARDQKSRQFSELLQAETRQLLAENGLSADYQLVPTLNFRNFASDAIAEKNLQLLNDIYGRAAAKAGTFLSPEELASFEEFRSAAINRNRLALQMNRQMMAPAPK